MRFLETSPSLCESPFSCVLYIDSTIVHTDYRVVTESTETITTVTVSKRPPPFYRTMYEWMLFLGLLTVQLGPVLYALRSDTVKDPVPHPSPLTRDTHPQHCAPQCAVLVGAYVVLFVMTRVIVEACDWKRNEKSVAEHKEDLLRMMLLTVVIATVGKAQHRVRDKGKVFLSWVTFYTINYTLLFQVKLLTSIHNIIKHRPSLVSNMIAR